MKTKYIIYAVLLLAILPFASCKQETLKGDGSYGIDGISVVDGDCIDIHVAKEGYGFHKNLDGIITTECYSYTVRTEGKWKLIPKSENTSWVRFLSMEGEGDSKIYFGIAANSTFFVREAFFTISINGEEKPNTLIHITQDAVPTTFSLPMGSTYSINSSGGSTAVAVSTNTGASECKIEYPEGGDSGWLSFDEANSSTTEMVFKADANKGTEERYALVTINSKMVPKLKGTVKIIQNTAAMILFEDFALLNYTATSTIWDGTGEKGIESWSTAQAARGWTGLLNGTQTASRCFGRKGYILLGNGGRIGTVASPALPQLGSDVTDLNISFDCIGYVSESGTRDYSDLYIGIWGPGQIEGANEDLTVNYKQLGGSTTLRVKHIEVTNFPNNPLGVFPEGYNEWDSANAEIKFKVTGATAETRIILMGGYWENLRSNNKFDDPDPVANGVTYRRNNRNNRLAIDNFKVIRKY